MNDLTPPIDQALLKRAMRFSEDFVSAALNYLSDPEGDWDYTQEIIDHTTERVGRLRDMAPVGPVYQALDATLTTMMIIVRELNATRRYRQDRGKEPQ